MNEDGGVRRYEIFDLSIDPPRDGLHPVRVADSPHGQASELVQLPVVDDALRARLVDIETAVMTPRYDHGTQSARQASVVQRLGAQLFDALFQGSVGRAYAGSQAVVRERGHGLRVQLRIRDESLLELPWECLYDSDDGDFLALRVETSIARYPEVLGGPRPFEVDSVLRVLGVMVEVDEDAGSGARGERLLIARAFEDLQGKVEVEWLDNPTWRQLRDRVLAGEWHILHYVGHARPGFITLDDDGGSEPGELSGSDLAALLGERPSLRLAVINACEGARGDGGDVLANTARAIAKADVSAVVSMQYKILDSAALEFSRAFYRSVASRQSVDEAIVRARQAIHGAVEFTLQWMVPVLHMRSANGTLFAAQAAPDTRDGLATDGRLLFRNESWGQALEIFAELVDLDPDNHVWQCWRGLVKAELGMAEEARRDLADAVPHLSGLIDANQDDVALVALRGLANAALGQCEAAMADLDVAVRASVAGASEFLARGRCHAATGSTNQAIADYTRVLGLNPACAAALYERARVYAHADRLRDAVEDLDRAVKLRPDQVAYRLERADTNADLGEYMLASQDLAIAIEAHPDATDLYLKRGQLSYRAAYHGQTRDYEPAIEDYGRVVQNAPDNAQAWYLRGRAHWQMAEETGSLEHAALAADDLTEATRRDDTQGRYHFYLGQSLARLGRRRQARQSYLRAVALGYEDARSRLGLWDRLTSRRGA
jgi:tetratricopeptide (TPR) repeat protein